MQSEFPLLNFLAPPVVGEMGDIKGMGQNNHVCAAFLSLISAFEFKLN